MYRYSFFWTPHYLIYFLICCQFCRFFRWDNDERNSKCFKWNVCLCSIWVWRGGWIRQEFPAPILWMMVKFNIPPKGRSNFLLKNLFLVASSQAYILSNMLLRPVLAAAPSRLRVVSTQIVQHYCVSRRLASLIYVTVQNLVTEGSRTPLPHPPRFSPPPATLHASFWGMPNCLHA